MAVVTFVRYSGGKWDAVINAVKQGKTFLEKAGAEWVRLSQIHTGPHAGQWLVSIRYPDWATYGKAQQALTSNAAYQKFLADNVAMVQLQERTIVVGIDV
jgi:hypothetical protein